MGPSASTVAREAYFLEYAEQIRAATKVPLLLTGGFRTTASMADAIRSGAIDAIGIARPMTNEPELPARLLDGSATGAREVHFGTGIRRLDDLANMAWYQHQMVRLADGLEPDLTLSGWRALWRGLRRMNRRAPERRELAASATGLAA